MIPVFDARDSRILGSRTLTREPWKAGTCIPGRPAFDRRCSRRKGAATPTDTAFPDAPGVDVVARIGGRSALEADLRIGDGTAFSRERFARPMSSKPRGLLAVGVLVGTVAVVVAAESAASGRATVIGGGHAGDREARHCSRAPVVGQAVHGFVPGQAERYRRSASARADRVCSVRRRQGDAAYGVVQGGARPVSRSSFRRARQAGC